MTNLNYLMPGFGAFSSRESARQNIYFKTLTDPNHIGALNTFNNGWTSVFFQLYYVSGSGDWYPTMSFPEVNLVQGTKVYAAHLYLNVNTQAASLGPIGNLHGQTIDSGGNSRWSSTNKPINATSIGSINSLDFTDVQQYSFDVTTIVQSMLDSSEWIYGNWINFWIEPTSGNGTAVFDKTNDTYSPQLIIVTGDYDFSLTASADDGHYLTTSNLWIPTQLQIKDNGGAGFNEYGGLSFPNIDIPANTAVLDAKIYLNITTAFTNEKMDIWGQDIDTDGVSQQWSGSNTPPSATPTTATVNNVDISSTGEVAVDVTTVAQEIINMSNWAVGNRMNFIMFPSTATSNGTTFTDAIIQNGLQPKLVIKLGPQIVKFNFGSYLRRSSALTGFPAGTALPGWTLSFWLRNRADYTQTQSILTGITAIGGFGDVATFLNDLTATEEIRASIYDASTFTWNVLAKPTGARVNSDGKLVHILMQYNKAATANQRAKVYKDGVLIAASDWDSVATDPEAPAKNWQISGKAVAPSQTLFYADIGGLWFDDSLPTIDKFYNNGYPADLGSIGQKPTGAAPLLYFDKTAWSTGTNLGTGGGFNLTGTVENT